MVHVARRVLGAIVVLAIVAGATVALSSRPRLKSDRNAVERSWSAVHASLAERYVLVDKLARAVDATGGPPNPLVDDIESTYASWQALKADGPVASAIVKANALEGLALRLATTVKASPILAGDPAVTAALRNVSTNRAPAGITALNEAVARYEHDRGGPVRRLVAGPLGFATIPRLIVQATA